MPVLSYNVCYAYLNSLLNKIYLVLCPLCVYVNLTNFAELWDTNICIEIQVTTLNSNHVCFRTSPTLLMCNVDPRIRVHKNYQLLKHMFNYK